MKEYKNRIEKAANDITAAQEMLDGALAEQKSIEADLIIDLGGDEDTARRVLKSLGGYVAGTPLASLAAPMGIGPHRLSPSDNKKMVLQMASEIVGSEVTSIDVMNKIRAGNIHMASASVHYYLKQAGYKRVEEGVYSKPAKAAAA